jgi:hypothetical protein
MANKAGNCPSSVTGAKSELIEDKTLPNAVVLSITASDAAAVDTIRTRTAHLVGVQAAPDAQVKHSGEGTGGGAGMCPVITSKDVTIASSEIPGGVKVVLTPAGAATAQDLAREVVGRIDQINAFRPAPAADGTPGGGGGAGGGQRRARRQPLGRGRRPGQGLGAVDDLQLLARARPRQVLDHDALETRSGRSRASSSRAPIRGMCSRPGSSSGRRCRGRPRP